MKILKIFITIVLIFTLNNCRWFTGAGQPFLSGTRIHTPPGSPKFKKGFNDGCSTVLFARGNYFYRMLHKHTYDPKLIDDSEYAFGYKRGYSYCFQYSVGPTAQFGGGSDMYLYPYKNASNPFDQGMTAGSIDSTISYGALQWWTAGSLDGVISQTQNSGNGSVFGSYPGWGTPSTGQFFGD